MLDFITVVFQDEIHLLEIQARSIDQYITNVNQIVVVVNDDYLNIDTSWWGRHQDKVIVKQRDHFNFTLRGTGWETQQLFKLLAAGESTTNWSMVLDAKTWFIKPLDIDLLFDEQQRPRVGLGAINPHFKPTQQFVEKYYNIKLPAILGPSGVPFMIHAESCRELIQSFDNFTEFFQQHQLYPHLLTEFYLYSAFLIVKYGSLDVLYNTQDCYLQSVNIADWESDNFTQLFNQMSISNRIIAASIHRRTYQKLSKNDINTWHNFLVSRKLISEHNTLNNYIKEINYVN